MKVQGARTESRTDRTATPPPSPATQVMDIPVDDIVPDEENRPIDTSDEDFLELVESIRVLGVLQRVHVRAREEANGGGYHLIDGERRWRAASEAGRATIPCEVWPKDASARDVKVAGLVLNEQRKAHGPLQVARRLRQLKNEFVETQDELAKRTGLALMRVKNYLALFGASDGLLDFFEKQDLPLRIACEFMRYEKSLGEAAARRLAKEYAEAPMTLRDLERLRKRHEAAEGRRADDATDRQSPAKHARRAPSFRRPLEAALRADADAALRELGSIIAVLGLMIVAADAVVNGAER